MEQKWFHNGEGARKNDGATSVVDGDNHVPWYQKAIAKYPPSDLVDLQGEEVVHQIYTKELVLFGRVEPSLLYQPAAVYPWG
mmetsp:Transcript_14408/g.27415  ORF Transcript_14408/g.27415 Transcript_14408/m.27415 type:complete len:82 (-) Transcript_14408:88-333(-)